MCAVDVFQSVSVGGGSALGPSFASEALRDLRRMDLPPFGIAGVEDGGGGIESPRIIDDEDGSSSDASEVGGGCARSRRNDDDRAPRIVSEAKGTAAPSFVATGNCSLTAATSIAAPHPIN